MPQDDAYGSTVNAVGKGSRVRVLEKSIHFRDPDSEDSLEFVQEAMTVINLGTGCRNFTQVRRVIFPSAEHRRPLVARSLLLGDKTLAKGCYVTVQWRLVETVISHQLDTLIIKQSSFSLDIVTEPHRSLLPCFKKLPTRHISESPAK